MLVSRQVFEFKNYRDYLCERLGQPGKRSGLRLRASKALGCHTTYLSQVLSERAHLSLEHAESLNQFFQHSIDESEFFINLVIGDRAGTKPLRERFLNRNKEIVSSRNKIRSRIKTSSEISAEDQSRFYSHWVYTAVHVLVSIPEFQTIEKLAIVTGFSIPSILDILDFLLKIGVIQKKDGKYSPGVQVLHLGADSSSISKHHTNWRFHTIQSIGKQKSDDLHYSACFSLNKETAQKIREAILTTLQSNVELVKNAREEDAFVYTFDFYQLT